MYGLTRDGEMHWRWDLSDPPSGIGAPEAASGRTRPVEPRPGMKYTREKDLMSLGVLYEVLNQPSLTDRTEELKKRAKMDKPPTTEEIVRTFLPEL